MRMPIFLHQFISSSFLSHTIILRDPLVIVASMIKQLWNCHSESSVPCLVIRSSWLIVVVVSVIP